MQMGSARPACTLLEPQLLFWEGVTQDEFSSVLKQGKQSGAAGKAFLGVSLKVSRAVGLPVPARARTKPPAGGARCGLGTGTLGQLRAPWGADGEGDPQAGTGVLFAELLLELEQGCVRTGSPSPKALRGLGCPWG